ncbi:hypothetical protein WEB32_12685 [Streptomyces netropsis]|uniref:Uncharacterized protein n=1 Tax=Streptomyces netropsis TaxID=55404 RepID=A0A7W7L5Y4_STRNE|nr:hypothetical protein [Streptomyces netropsis]MBB4884099.1 hypothetical protein [Streptomyces netropsis]GGR06115.1 hypothetical protein GCM10010219_08180 [Streptomyces netropsis]
MDSARFAFCGVLVAAAVVCAAPAHAVDDPATMSGTVELTPVTSHPGGEVQLRVSGCGNNKATASSEAFVSDAVLAKDSAGLFAEATVRSTVAPGVYPVKVNCDGYDAMAAGRLTIVNEGEEPPGARDRQDDRVGAEPHDRPDGHTVPDGRLPGNHTLPDSPTSELPIAPVPAGGGGTSSMATAEAPGTPGLVLAGGTALIAAGVIWYRRRNEAAQRRDTDESRH